MVMACSEGEQTGASSPFLVSHDSTSSDHTRPVRIDMGLGIGKTDNGVDPPMSKQQSLLVCAEIFD
jgi:hypothetical protein